MVPFLTPSLPTCPRSNSPKALAKLRHQVRRTTEILSANTAAPINAEELHNTLAVPFDTFACCPPPSAPSAPPPPHPHSKSPKALAKLRRQVRRTKEILSANTAAPISVEELHNGQDFSSSIKRADLENLAGDFWDRAAVSVPWPLGFRV
jgi:molecular chaperone DnaK (HSP70)